MATKLKTFEDCYSGREMRQVAQGMEDLGVTVEKNGSYVDIGYQGHHVYPPDSDRAMPKQSRIMIFDALRKIGLIVAGLTLALAYLMGWL